jgi:hypothetical protein
MRLRCKRSSAAVVNSLLSFRQIRRVFTRTRRFSLASMLRPASLELLRATLVPFGESVRGRIRLRILNCVSDRDHMELAGRSICGAMLFRGRGITTG